MHSIETEPDRLDGVLVDLDPNELDRVPVAAYVADAMGAGGDRR